MWLLSDRRYRGWFSPVQTGLSALNDDAPQTPPATAARNARIALDAKTDKVNGTPNPPALNLTMRRDSAEDLTVVHGIGPKVQELLYAAQIYSVEALTKANAQAVSKSTGIVLKKVRNIISAAKTELSNRATNK